MQVKVITHSGSDLLVVNAARVSMGKHKTEFDDSDKRLIAYLAKHNHWTPFSHCSATVYVKCPFFVARQIYRHVIGYSFNEISGRYVQFVKDYWKPKTWRKQSPSIKQGSSPDSVEGWKTLFVNLLYSANMEFSYFVYFMMLRLGVCKEQARAALPLAMNTEFYVTGSLAAWARMYNLRADSHAQRETQEYAIKVGDKMKELFPYSWEALTNEK